jgi:hypothetical protein
MARKAPPDADEFQVENRLETEVNPEAAASLFEAILRGVRSATARKRKERDANGRAETDSQADANR